MNRWILLLVASAVVAESLVFFLVIKDPDPYCFGYELGLVLVAGAIVPLAGAFVCGFTFSLARVRSAAYVVAAASLSLVTVGGFVLGLLLGYDHCVPASLPDRVIPVAVIGFGATTAGLSTGFAVGWLLRRGSALIRRGRPPTA